jgi:hypothetical protein
MFRRVAAVAVLVFALLSAAVPQTDGPDNPLKDPLLDNLAGLWSLTGKIAGQDAAHNVQAEWVLNHQWLRIHERDPKPRAAGGRMPYEAMVFVGYDNAGKKYVVHWLDVWGGRFAEAVGYGTREGNTIKIVFDYPDGPFHTNFTWVPESQTWKWFMEQKDKSGKWKPFGEMTLTAAH